jgi:23S rRNA (guanosine2251-2'-O)-methyltransferase
MYLVLIAHNVRSAHNVGSLLRTAEGLGVGKVYLTGYSPYPAMPGDSRLPHLAQKTDRQISKTALGAEKSIEWQHEEDILKVIRELRADDYEVVALEQTPQAPDLTAFKPKPKTALVVGREVEGIEAAVLELADRHVQIKMHGRKESLNVAVAAGIALHWLKA